MDIANTLIGRWLSLPPVALLAVLVTVEVGAAVLLHALIEGRLAGGFLKRFCRTTPIMMMPITVMFSLLVGFLGAEIGQRNQRAERCVAEEARALETIHFLMGNNDVDGVRQAAHHYATIAVDDEYPEFFRRGELGAATAAVDTLSRAAGEYARSAGSSAVAAGGIMESVLLLKRARGERMIVLRENSGYAWITVLALSLLAICAIGCSHLEDASMRLTAWGLFLPAVVIVLGMLALRENPYSPPLSVSATPLETARGHLAPP